LDIRETSIWLFALPDTVKLVFLGELSYLVIYVASSSGPEVRPINDPFRTHDFIRLVV